MQTYAKVIDEETKACIVGLGDPDGVFSEKEELRTDEETGAEYYETVTVTVGEYYASQGMTLQEVEQSEDGWWYLAGYAPQKSLEERKEEAYSRLWSNYKAHQTKYVDAEDLTLATICAAYGSEKGKAVQMWVMNLWAQYYTVKDAITAAGSAEALAAVDLTAEAVGVPLYTIRELNEEAAAAMAEEK